MAVVTFYAKPGCINNERQYRLLLEAGHKVVIRDLLREAWTSDSLRRFLGALPVGEWFNPSSPRVRSGEVDPKCLGPEQALELLSQDPLLIRRPLMEAEGQTAVGFDPERVDAWLGLARAPGGDLETCPRIRSSDPNRRQE